MSQVRADAATDIQSWIRTKKAMDYAALHGAEGAVFFFSRSTETEVQGPPVRDKYGKRHDTSPIKVVSHAMQVGRFWYGQ